MRSLASVGRDVGLINFKGGRSDAAVLLASRHRRHGNLLHYGGVSVCGKLFRPLLSSDITSSTKIWLMCYGKQTIHSCRML
jgi:hypothetical protein